MAEYSIELHSDVESFLEKLDREERERIFKRIDRLENNPRHFGERRGNFWILKVGRAGYRLAFDIEEDKKLVQILDIAKRGSHDYEKGFY